MTRGPTLVRWARAKLCEALGGAPATRPTDAWTREPGATFVTLFASRAMARPSASVSRPVALARTPDCWTLSGLMKSMFEPNESI